MNFRFCPISFENSFESMSFILEVTISICDRINLLVYFDPSSKYEKELKSIGPSTIKLFFHIIFVLLIES